MWRTDEPVAIAGGHRRPLRSYCPPGARYPVVVLERAARATLVGAGISLWPNAVRGLNALGVGAAVCARSAHVHNSTLRTSDGKTLSEVDVASLAARAGAPLLMVRAQLFPGHEPHNHDVFALRAVVESAAVGSVIRPGRTRPVS